MKRDSSILVSIIVTNYNYAHYLPDALSSVFAQTMSNWECLIIDDGSTDNSKDIVQQFTEKDERFIYIYQPNQGLAASRNNGMAVAKGKYFQFLDADDKICADKLHFQSAFLESHPEVDIVYGDHLFFDSDNPERHFHSKSKTDRTALSPKKSGKGPVILQALIKNNIMVVSAPLIRSSIYHEGIAFDTSYNTLEDWRFWIDCALKNYSFRYLQGNKTETLIRFGHSSMMSALIKMNLGGQKIRKYLHPHLSTAQKIYNSYRKQRLLLKYLYLKLFRK